MNQKLRDARKALNLKQTEIASCAGVSYRQYQKIEAGESCPSVDKAIRIAAVLNAPVEEIFSDPEHVNYNTRDPEENTCKHEEYLEEGERIVDIITRASEVINCSKKVARLMVDIGKNGRVDGEEFRPVFEQLREAVNGALV